MQKVCMRVLLFVFWFGWFWIYWLGYVHCNVYFLQVLSRTERTVCNIYITTRIPILWGKLLYTIGPMVPWSYSNLWWPQRRGGTRVWHHQHTQRFQGQDQNPSQSVLIRLRQNYKPRLDYNSYSCATMEPGPLTVVLENVRSDPPTARPLYIHCYHCFDGVATSSKKSDLESGIAHIDFLTQLIIFMKWASSILQQQSFIPALILCWFRECTGRGPFTGLSCVGEQGVTMKYDPAHLK